MKDFLIGITRTRASESGRTWFEEALATTAGPVEKNKLSGYYTGASRRLGKVALQLEEEEKQRLQSLDPLLPLDHWGLDEAGRAALLLSLAHLPSQDYAQLVLACYELGDTREQQSWLRALSLLPECENFLETAIDACRVNVLPLFEAIACENPYPSRYFLEASFNQMVLKSLFNSVQIARIVGLESRLNDDLSRMADDYVTEREAAGREVPTDIWLVLAPRISKKSLPRVYGYLHHENLEHRYWVAMGLGHVADDVSRGELQKRREVETEQKVIGAIEESLAKLVCSTPKKEPHNEYL